ncbi:MAG TPA: hypothetical protein VN048_02675 [Verrucomicrobiae bacterium]|jgi:hypothetical protein|nr:hypothetical protein [Verrucomicrobiae bacterium]
MKRTMLAADLPEPIFCQIQVSNTAVKVVLRNNIEQRKVWVDADAAAVIGQMISAGLNPLEKRVINFAAEYKTISVSQAARLTQKSWPFAKKLLESLLAKRILMRFSPNPEYDRDPAARYALNK